MRVIFPYWVSISITSLNLTLARDWINFIEASLSMLATSSGYKSYIFSRPFWRSSTGFFPHFFFLSRSILSNARRKMEIKSRYGNGDIRTGIYMYIHNISECMCSPSSLLDVHECIYQSTFSLDELHKMRWVHVIYRNSQVHITYSIHVFIYMCMYLADGCVKVNR